MEYKTRAYPLFSACGLNCGLCPRFHTSGESRCPGCEGEGFSQVHPPCGVLSCSQRKDIEYCFLCGDFPCTKYDGADLSDSFISHKNQFLDMEKAKQTGMESYKTQLDEKVKLLEMLLCEYNDGRRKSFFCTAVNLLDLQDVKSVVARIADETQDGEPRKIKAAAAVRLFNEVAQKRDISLKLRK